MTHHPPVLDTTDPDRVRNVLVSAGALLVRVDDPSVERFTQLSDSLMVPMTHHATNTKERDPVGDDATTSTVNKGFDSIPLHREGSYAPGCPDALVFYCDRPSDSGGATVFCDGARVFDALPGPVRDFVADLELHWSWEARPVRWKQMLGAPDRERAAAALDRLRTTLKPYESLTTEFVGDVLHGRFVTRCVIPSWGDRTPSFCNSLMIYTYRGKSEYYERDAFRVHLSDGTPFPRDVLDEIRAIAEGVSTDIRWRAGDIGIIDNSRFMHGRRAVDDPHRRILLRMGYLTGAAA